MQTRKFRIPLFMTLFWPAPMVWAAPTPEEVLADAARYTVKIQRLNEVAFNQDSGGDAGGTGFVIDRERGWILTNAHVATRSPSVIKVVFKGSRPIEAKRLHVDPVIDLALLSIDPRAVPATATAAAPACQSRPQAGLSVFAYGHPWGLSFTASRGIVSGHAWFYPNHMIQTDAVINSGNSGGPLISLNDGQIIGINTSTFQPEQDDNGATAISLATPMPEACKIIELLKAGKDTRLRILPITVATAGDDLRPRVARVLQARLDLAPGDIIKAVNDGPELATFADLLSSLRGLDGTVVITVDRKGRLVRMPVPITIMPDPLRVRAINLSGLIIAEPWRIDDFEYNPERSLTIDWVQSGGDAALTEARAYDYISSVDGRSFQEIDALYNYLDSLESDAVVEMILKRSSPASEFHREYHYIEINRGNLQWILAD